MPGVGLPLYLALVDHFLEMELNGVFFKFFRLLKIENTGEQELAGAREKSTGK